MATYIPNCLILHCKPIFAFSLPAKYFEVKVFYSVRKWYWLSLNWQSYLQLHNSTVYIQLYIHYLLINNYHKQVLVIYWFVSRKCNAELYMCDYMYFILVQFVSRLFAKTFSLPRLMDNNMNIFQVRKEWVHAIHQC